MIIWYHQHNTRHNNNTETRVHSRFEFSDELDLNKYIDEEGESDDYMFLLYAVLVHSGDFHGGHYVVYINTSLSANNTAPNQQKVSKLIWKEFFVITWVFSGVSSMMMSYHEQYTVTQLRQTLAVMIQK